MIPDFFIVLPDGRDRVIGYVKKKYGAESVSQIDVRHDGRQAAVRDVGRVLDLPCLFCDGIAKLIPFQPAGRSRCARPRGRPLSSNATGGGSP